jgi:hypothetical protein
MQGMPFHRRYMEEGARRENHADDLEALIFTTTSDMWDGLTKDKLCSQHPSISGRLIYVH